jgi:hypothetical protein
MDDKDTKLSMSGFFQIDLLTDFAACVNRLEIHSLIVSCELLPLYLLSDLPHPSSSPLSKVNAQYIIQTLCG